MPLGMGGFPTGMATGMVTGLAGRPSCRLISGLVHPSPSSIFASLLRRSGPSPAGPVLRLRHPGSLLSCGGSGGAVGQPVRCGSAWLERRQGDPYVRLSKVHATRSRASFKLDQLQQRYKFLRPGHVVYDLGAAPGGWAEVAKRYVLEAPPPRAAGPKQRARIQRAPPPPTPQGYMMAVLREEDYGRAAAARKRAAAVSSSASLAPSPDAVLTPTARGAIYAVDLCTMDPILGVHVVHGDARLLKDARYPMADVVLSDMAPSFTGHENIDMTNANAIADLVIEMVDAKLKRGGTLVHKFFAGQVAESQRDEAHQAVEEAETTSAVAVPDMTRPLVERLEARFGRVMIAKPHASRSQSSEAYLVCRKFRRDTMPEPITSSASAAPTSVTPPQQTR